jgi:hypothetical protein
MTGRRPAGVVAALLAVVGCAEMAPLREPPALYRDDPTRGVKTRDQALARLGAPAEVRVSDIGEVLVYRRLATREANPARYYGEYRGDRLDRYDRILIFLDAEGQVARVAIEPE